MGFLNTPQHANARMIDRSLSRSGPSLAALTDAFTKTPRLENLLEYPVSEIRLDLAPAIAQGIRGLLTDFGAISKLSADKREQLVSTAIARPNVLGSLHK